MESRVCTGMTTTVERFVPVDGGELCLQGFGDPTAPAVVLVAGAAGSMDWWDVELCERIADGGRHVVRYDHRDTGRSVTETPGEPTYDAGQLDRDCVALIESLAAGPVHLVGLSMGGGIAQSIALRCPDLVATLTLVATSPVGGVDSARLPGPVGGAAAYFASPPADPDWSDLASYADWVVAGEEAFAGAIPVDRARLREVAATVHARSNDVAAAGNHWIVVGGEGDDEPFDVRRIAAPTLVVHGTHDPLFPLSHGEALADAVPGARLLVVPGMGHQVPPPSTWDLVVPPLLEHTERRTA